MMKLRWRKPEVCGEGWPDLNRIVTGGDPFSEG